MEAVVLSGVVDTGEGFMLPRPSSCIFKNEQESCRQRLAYWFFHDSQKQEIYVGFGKMSSWTLFEPLEVEEAEVDKADTEGYNN